MYFMITKLRLLGLLRLLRLLVVLLLLLVLLTEVLSMHEHHLFWSVVVMTVILLLVDWFVEEWSQLEFSLHSSLILQELMIRVSFLSDEFLYWGGGEGFINIYTSCSSREGKCYNTLFSVESRDLKQLSIYIPYYEEAI